MAVYTVDIFTAVNLLAFNKWSSEIKPAISFDITKWIFSISIILSIVNLGYEHIRAQMIIRRGSVAESFLDNLAVRLQSIRFGSGKGWRRFLVFAELTKSKKGAEYIALFTYFSFQGTSLTATTITLPNYFPLTLIQRGFVSSSVPARDRLSMVSPCTRCTPPNCRLKATPSSQVWRVSSTRSKRWLSRITNKPSSCQACSSPSLSGSCQRCHSFSHACSSSSSSGVGFPGRMVVCRDTASARLPSD